MEHQLIRLLYNGASSPQVSRKTAENAKGAEEMDFLSLRSLRPLRFFLSIITCCLLIISNHPLGAQGFESTSIEWPVPIGGAVQVGVNLGYYDTESSAQSNPGGDVWATLDLNGDELADLVVAAHDSANGQYVFNAYSSPHWRVFLGNGLGFDSTWIDWPVPDGGFYYIGKRYGYNGLHHLEFPPPLDSGSTQWGVRDINGDHRPDLIVTGKVIFGTVCPVYAQSAAPHWRVYLNTGTGFSTTYIDWTLPTGGRLRQGVPVGYDLLEYDPWFTSSNYQERSWKLEDMDGDAMPDLVVVGQNHLPDDKIVPFGSVTRHWLVFRNSGTGFDTTAIEWKLPSGGIWRAGEFFSYNFWHPSANASLGDSSQNWNVVDMDHDDKPDLVVTGQNRIFHSLQVFGIDSLPHWRIFRNLGDRFDSISVDYQVPRGGAYQIGVPRGFCTTEFEEAEYYDLNCQNWNLLDIDADGWQDIVVESEMQTGIFASYSPNYRPYWKVFYGNSGGFDTLAFQWPVPLGGLMRTGTQLGFPYLQENAANGYNNGSNSYVVRDLNGDGRPDLVRTAFMSSQVNAPVVWNRATDPYWNVHLNSALPIGTPESNAGMAVNVFPNPTSETLFVDAGAHAGTLIVCDITGRQVHQQALRRYEVAGVDVHEWAAGVYVATFRNGEATVWRKVVVE